MINMKIDIRRTIMPLKKGRSKKVISNNISKCMHEGGRSHKQCIAIAMSKAGKNKRSRKK